MTAVSSQYFSNKVEAIPAVVIVPVVFQLVLIASSFDIDRAGSLFIFVKWIEIIATYTELKWQIIFEYIQAFIGPCEYFFFAQHKFCGFRLGY